MAYIKTRNCKLMVYGDEIIGIGNLIISSPSISTVDITSFGDRYKYFYAGISDGSTISFSGNFHYESYQIFEQYFTLGSHLTSLKFYIGNNLCWILDPDYSSYLLLKTISIETSSKDICKIKFDGSIVGKMVVEDLFELEFFWEDNYGYDWEEDTFIDSYY